METILIAKNNGIFIKKYCVMKNSLEHVWCNFTISQMCFGFICTVLQVSECWPENFKEIEIRQLFLREMRYLGAFCPQRRFSLALMNRITRCLLAISFSWGDTPTLFFTTLLIFSEY